MSGTLILRRAALVLAAVLLFATFVFLFYPVSSIDAAIEQLLAPYGLRFLPEARKSVPPGLAWDNLLMSSEQGEILHCDMVRVRPLLLPLLLGRVLFSGTASIGGGRIKAEYALNGSDALDFTADNIDLSDTPFFRSVFGAKSSGIFRSHGKLLRQAKVLSGEFRLELLQLQFSGVRIGGFQLPDAAGLKSQGLLKVFGGKTRLESLTLEGDGIYMRLSGDLPTGAGAVVSPLNMTLEMMPRPEFIEKQKLVFMLLARFMTSPGVYRLPIRGTLLKPEIAQ